MEAWIARDEDGQIFVYSNKPEKEDNIWVNSDFCFLINESELSEGINPKWEDDEPTKVKLKIEKSEKVSNSIRAFSYKEK